MEEIMRAKSTEESQWIRTLPAMLQRACRNDADDDVEYLAYLRSGLLVAFGWATSTGTPGDDHSVVPNWIHLDGVLSVRNAAWESLYDESAMVGGMDVPLSEIVFVMEPVTLPAESAGEQQKEDADRVLRVTY
jgi:hypothetical protein